MKIVEGPYELPASWVWTTASEACVKIQDGTHFSPKVQLEKGNYRYVTAKNVRPSGLDLADITYLREEDHKEIYKRCDTRKGDVLLVKDGVNTGDTAINTLEDEISLLSSVCFLRPHNGLLDPRFLRYFLASPTGSALLTGRMSGTAIKRIILRRIKETKVPIAPMLDQKRIVQSIESNLTKLDAAVAALKRVKSNLKRYRASVLKAAVEGRLVPTEAELARKEGRDYEPASKLLERILKERRRRWEEAELEKLKAKGKISKTTILEQTALGGDKKHLWKAKYKEPKSPDTTNLPELPEGWCLASVYQLARHRLGKMLDKAKNKGTPRPYLRNANVRWFGFDLSDLLHMRVEDRVPSDN